MAGNTAGALHGRSSVFGVKILLTGRECGCIMVHESAFMNKKDAREYK